MISDTRIPLTAGIRKPILELRLTREAIVERARAG